MRTNQLKSTIIAYYIYNYYWNFEDLLIFSTTLNIKIIMLRMQCFMIYKKVKRWCFAEILNNEILTYIRAESLQN